MTYVDVSEYGLGVFADKNFNKGDLVELSPSIKLSKGDQYFTQNTVISNYTFGSGTEYDDSEYLALGNGSLFNHNNEPNIEAEIVTYQGS